MISWLRLTTVAALLFATWGSEAFSAFFDPLFRITQVQGPVSVMKPGDVESAPASEGQAYPYGTRVRVGKAHPKAKDDQIPGAHLILSNDHQFKLGPGGDLVVNHGEGGDAAKKVLELASGNLRTYITISKVLTGGKTDADVLAGIDALTVKTPLGVVCSKLTERNEITVAHDGRHHTVVFGSGGSLMELAGPQYKVHSIKRNSGVEIFGDKDFTRLSSLGGEFMADVERGVDEIESVSFKNRSIVKIWRTYAEIGGKMAVSVMVVAPDGSINSYAFLEGQVAVVDSAIASEKPVEGAAAPTTAPEGGGEGLGEAAGVETNGAPDVGDAPATDGAAAEAPVAGGAEGGETINFNFDNW
jgi:hypothetical protein